MTLALCSFSLNRKQKDRKDGYNTTTITWMLLSKLGQCTVGLLSVSIILHSDPEMTETANRSALLETTLQHTPMSLIRLLTVQHLSIKISYLRCLALKVMTSIIHHNCLLHCSGSSVYCWLTLTPF